MIIHETVTSRNNAARFFFAHTVPQKPHNSFEGVFFK